MTDVIAKKTITKGLIKGMNYNSQLNEQGAAVTPVAYTSAGAISPSDTVVTVAGSAQAYTLSNPVPGKLMIIADVASGTVTVTTSAGSTFDGTNNTATMNATADVIAIYGISSTRWLILYNISTVLSSA